MHCGRKWKNERKRAMTKTELVNDMRRQTGASFITRKQLAEYLGKKDPHSVDGLIHGLTRFAGKKYFIADVAEQIMLTGR